MVSFITGSTAGDTNGNRFPVGPTVNLAFGQVVLQVAQLSQRDCATHELLRFAKLRSGIFEPPFGGLRGKVGALSIPRWKAPDRLPINDK